ncbi:MAG: hypothetical protein ACI33M_00765 [Lysinibacillus sp.]
MKWFSRIIVIGISLCFILSAITYMYLENGLPWKYEQMEEQMRTYLEQRYKDEFAFDSVQFDWRNRGSYSTMATAQSTGVQFYVAVSNDGKVEDAYSYEHWSHEWEKYFVPIIKQHYKEFQQMNSISLDVRFDQALPPNKSLEEHKVYTWWNVNVHILKELTDDDFKTAFNILQAIQQEGLQLEQLTLAYFDVVIQILEQEIPLITNAKDIAKFVKTYEEVY